MPVPLFENIPDLTKIFFNNYILENYKRMKSIVADVLGKRIFLGYKKGSNFYHSSDVINLVCTLFSTNNGVHIGTSSSHLLQSSKCKESFKVNNSMYSSTILF